MVMCMWVGPCCTIPNVAGPCGRVSAVIPCPLRPPTGKQRWCLLAQIREYCTEDKACRHALLLEYFGERFAAGRCRGKCDNCLGVQNAGTSVWKVSTLHCDSVT
jgi:hypothetical protein